MTAVEIVSILLILSLVGNIVQAIRIAVLRNNLSLFGEKLKIIEKKLQPQNPPIRTNHEQETDKA